MRKPLFLQSGTFSAGICLSHYRCYPVLLALTPLELERKLEGLDQALFGAAFEVEGPGGDLDPDLQSPDLDLMLRRPLLTQSSTERRQAIGRSVAQNPSLLTRGEIVHHVPAGAGGDEGEEGWISLEAWVKGFLDGILDLDPQISGIGGSGDDRKVREKDPGGSLRRALHVQVCQLMLRCGMMCGGVVKIYCLWYPSGTTHQ